jgi:predicted DNA-binding transcriptional regulator AlpA
MSQTDQLLNVTEAAAVLGVSVGTMYTRRSEGQGPVAYKRGRRLVYPKSQLDAFLVREREKTTKGDER